MQTRHTSPTSAAGLRELARRRAGSRLALRAYVRALCLLIAAFLALPACKIDCFDDAELEAAYREGEQAAIDANAVEFDRGKTTGLSLTYADGERDGAVEGYEDGYGTGYTSIAGYPSGYSAGFDRGNSDGVFDPTACTNGSADGLADGDMAGYTDGYDAAYQEGFDTGYPVGYDDGAATCNAAARTLAPPPSGDGSDPDDVRHCYDRGFDKLLDPFAYERGLAEGKRLNPEYQAGYVTTYAPNFDRGERDGVVAGYSDGWNDGYATGYATGYASVYDGCYNGSYSSAYSAGYDDGWEVGWPAGYDAGYYDGYSDGAACE